MRQSVCIASKVGRLCVTNKGAVVFGKRRLCSRIGFGTIGGWWYFGNCFRINVQQVLCSDGRVLFLRSLLLFGMCKLLRSRRRFFVEGRFGISGEGFLLTSYGLHLLQCSVAFGCRCWSNRMQPAARKQWSAGRVRFRVQGIGYIELLRGKIAVRLYMPPARKHG